MSERGAFNGRIGFVIATAASAVGLGNIWRFPTTAASDGGGTFLLAYIIIVIVFGLAMITTEVALGRMTRRSPVEAYGTLDTHGKIIGYLSVAVPAIILPYYCVIGGWIFGYAGGYCAGYDMDAPGLFLDFAASDIAIVTFIIFLALVSIAIYKGVSKGIERLSIIFMPIFLVMLVALTVYVLLQPGSGEGLSYYLSFDLSRLSTNTFIDALGQAFFSLSIAMGILITYGSYMNSHVNIERSTASIIFIDTMVAILAGLFIVPLTFSAGQIGTGGAGLVFMALPGIFDVMPAGNIVAITFFVMLAIAALTSAISVMEAVVSTVVDLLHVSRRRATVMVTLPTVLVGAIISMGFGPLSSVMVNGLGILDIFDYTASNLIMPIVAFMMCIFIGHIVGPRIIVEEIEKSGSFHLKAIYPILVKWILPVLVLIIFVFGLGIFDI